MTFGLPQAVPISILLPSESKLSLLARTRRFVFRRTVGERPEDSLSAICGWCGWSPPYERAFHGWFGSDGVPSTLTAYRGALLASSLLWQSAHRLRSWPSLNAV